MALLDIIQPLRNCLSLNNIVQGLVAVIILAGLYLTSLQNYLLFHSIIEVTTIVIFFAIFVIVWNARRNITDIFFLIIGISCLFIGSIDLVHTLAYKGMGVFPGNDANLPTQIWIAARYYQSIAFLIATLLMGKSLTKDRKYDTEIILAVCTAGFALIMASIFGWHNFPPCYVEGVGLTGFKIGSEYVISLVMLLTIVLLVHKRRVFDPEVWKYLVASMVFLIIGELAFTSYISVYGFMNTIGHLAKLVSVYFLYRAIIVVSISRPFDLIFRAMKEQTEASKESEERFREIFDQSVAGKSFTYVPDGKLLQINRAFADMLGYTREELQQMNWADITYPDDIPESNECVRYLLAGEKTRYRVEKRYIHKNGTIVWGDVGTSLMRDADGKPLYLMTTIMDITERKRAEASLRETNEYLRNLQDYANAPIIVWDPQFRITQFNHAFERLTGRTEREVLGQHLEILFPEESKNASLDRIKETLAGERWEVVEIPILHVSGETRIVLWNSANIVNPSGTIVSTIAQGQDITERKQAEAALRETNEYLRNLQDYANAPIIVWDPQFRITRFNHAFERLTGRTEREVLGQHLEILFPEESKNASLDRIKETLAGERWEVVEIPILHVSGETRIVLWNSANIVNPSGTIVSTIAQGQDITERKRAEASLRESEESYRILASNLPGIVYRIYLRENNRMVFFNDQLEALSGYTSEELRKGTICSIEPFIHQEDLPVVLATVEKAVAKSAFFTVDYRFRHKDGNWRYFVERGKVVLGRDLAPQFIDGVIHDITDRKLAEKHREHLIAELEQKNAELERFTYTVSHDLKSPLITIRGYLGFLEEDALKQDAKSLKRDIELIKSATDKMEVLLRDLLSLSRIGRIANPPTEVPFTTISMEAAELLAGAIREKGVTVSINPQMPIVTVDHIRVREVVMNLIENAIKFMGDQPHPKIEIGVRKDGNERVFYVKDNGIGIEKKYHEKIFGLFEKLNANTEGSGAGLTIVKRIIEVHGGRIWVESEGKGKGTTFCFTLPGGG